jgi:AcrR family transcriptional regulator
MALKSARSIVTRDGLRGLSTRRVAESMGYSAGTLYQLFDDFDDLILQLNAETLNSLLRKCQDVNFDAEPENILLELAARYLDFVRNHPRLWNALFEHNLPKERNLPDWYESKVAQLLALADRALLSLFPNDHERRLHEAHVLWASLYGISSLASADKLATTENPQEIVRSLVRNYVAGLRWGR